MNYRTLLLFILLSFKININAQLSGKYCAGKPPYVSSCIVFIDSNRFEYYQSVQNDYYTGIGIYEIHKDTLILTFKTDSLIGNPFVIKTSNCNMNKATISIKAVDYETGETPFGGAYIVDNKDSVIVGDVLDMNGLCTLEVLRSDDSLRLKLASVGFKRYSMPMIPNKNYDIYIEMHTEGSHSINDGDKMIFRIRKIKKRSMIIGDFLHSTLDRKYKLWKQ